MQASTDQIAIWVLMALKEEWERYPSHLTCRTESAILGPLKSKHNIEDADITRGIRFLVERRMLQAVNRKDGRVTLPSPAGLEYLAAYIAAEKEKGWTLDRRLKIWTIIVAILGLLLTYTIWRLSK